VTPADICCPDYHREVHDVLADGDRLAAASPDAAAAALDNAVAVADATS
jgi:hypothetical protein